MNTRKVTISTNYVDGPLLVHEFIASLQLDLFNVPAECKATARLEITPIEPDEVRLEVVYERPETESERIETAKIERRRKLREEQHELAELTRLQKKYGKL